MRQHKQILSVHMPKYFYFVILALSPGLLHEIFLPSDFSYILKNLQYQKLGET